MMDVERFSEMLNVSQLGPYQIMRNRTSVQAGNVSTIYRSGINHYDVSLRALYHDMRQTLDVRVRTYVMTPTESAVFEWENGRGLRWIRKPSDAALVALLLKI